MWQPDCCPLEFQSRVRPFCSVSASLLWFTVLAVPGLPDKKQIGTQTQRAAMEASKQTASTEIALDSTWPRKASSLSKEPRVLSRAKQAYVLELHLKDGDSLEPARIQRRMPHVLLYNRKTINELQMYIYSGSTYSEALVMAGILQYPF